MAEAPNYSRSEWASLPIQKRIKAMNQATGEDDVESLPQPESLEEEEEPERPPLPKRSSVVDIWRQQKATFPETENPKKHVEKKPVSVPWPDDEDNKKPTKVEAATPSPKRLFLFGNLFRGRSVLKEEDKEADLTILPAKSKDDGAEMSVASDTKSAASHSKSVMDAWTKKALVGPDSPMTVSEEKAPLNAEVPLKGTSVVDIWSNRTVPTSTRTSTPKPLPPKEAFTSPKTAPLKHVEKEETDKAAVREEKQEEPSQPPSWRSPSEAKSVAAPPKIEGKGADIDITILPAESSEDAQVVAAASHSKNVVDAWTKKRMVLLDAPVTVEEKKPPGVDAEIPTKRSSVVDIWSKRTSVPAQTSKTTPKKDWTSPPKSAPHVEQDANSVIIQEEPSIEIRPSSIANRYKSAVGEAAPKLRQVPKPLVQDWTSPKNAPHVEDDADSIVVQEKPSSVVNRYKPAAGEAAFSTLKLRKVTKPDEAAKSSMVNRWQPQGNGTYQQLRKVPTKESPVASQSTVEKADDASETGAEEPKQSPSVTNRWQSSSPSSLLRKVQTNTLSAASQPFVDNADAAVAESGAEEPKQSPSVTNRWQPHGNGGTPPLRKVLPKKSPVVSPYGNGFIPQLRKVATKTSPVVSPYGNGSIPQLREVSTKASPPVVSQLSVEQTDEVVEPVNEEPKRSSVSNRWQPQGFGSTPQLRKVPKPVVLIPEATGETVDSTEEPKRISVLDRYKPQASESVQQLRRKVPTPILAEPEGMEETTSDMSKPPSVLDRYKPQRAGTTPAAWRRQTPSKAPDSEHKTESVEESKPQGSGAIPQLPKAHVPGTEAANKTSELTEEAEQSSMLERYKSQTKGSNVLDRYKLQGTGNTPIAQLRKAPTKELSLVRTEIAPNSHPSAPMKDLSPVRSKVAPESEDASKSVEEPKCSSVLNRYQPRGNASAPLGLRRKIVMNNRPPVVVQTVAGPLETTDTDAADIVDKVDEMEEEWALPTIDSSGSLPFDESSPGNVKKFLASANTIQVVQTESFETAENKILAVIETPMPIPAVSSRDTPAENSFMAKRENDSRGRNVNAPFQSGTSAFRAKGVASGPFSISDKPTSRSRPPRSMKEFLKQHQIKGFKDFSDMQDSTEKTDECISTKDSSTETDPYWIGAVPVSSPPPIEHDFQELEDEAEDDNLIAQDDEDTDTVLAVVVEDKPIVPQDSDVDKVPAADKPLDPTDVDTDTAPSMDVVKPNAHMDTDTDTILARAGETEQPEDEYEAGPIFSSKAMDSQDEPSVSNDTMDWPDEPGPIVSSGKAMDSPEEQPRSSTLTKSPEDKYNNASRRAARKKFLSERRNGRKSRGVGDDASTSSEPLSSTASGQDLRSARGALAPRKSTKDVSASTPGQENPTGNGYHPLRPSQHKPSYGLAVTTQSPHAFPDRQKDESGSRWSGRYNRAQNSRVRSNSLTPVVSESGASDTLTSFSGASSGYSAAVSVISLGPSVTSPTVISPTSALSNRASQMVVRRRRIKLSKAEEKIAAQHLARRVISQTIKEQPRPGVEEDDSAADHSSEQPPHEGDDHFEYPKSFETLQSAGLAGRYNTSSRFTDNVHNMIHGVGSGNTSFESETTEGSSQVRSVVSTSDSEGWMSGRVRKSSSSSRHNRVPSDSTDGELYYDSRPSDLITDDFVSASASNIEALKSAYKAVSLHQIAMDLTEEVSTATNLNLMKIASDLNDGVSAASESIRSSLGSPSRSPRKLKVPKSSGVGNAVDEEVAIEVEYVEDEDTDGEGDESEYEEIQSIGDLDSETEGVNASTEKEVTDNDERFESGVSPAGEPSHELGSPDRRRAYV